MGDHPHRRDGRAPGAHHLAHHEAGDVGWGVVGKSCESGGVGR